VRFKFQVSRCKFYLSLFIVHCSLLIAHCSLFIVHCPLFIYNRRMTHRQPRIAINAQLLHGGQGYRSAGIHTYTEQILRHLPQADPDLHYTLFTQHPPHDLDPSIEIKAARWPTERPTMRILWEQIAQPHAVRRAQADVLHATAFVGPIIRSCPTVLTIYDLSFALFPQFFRGLRQTYLRVGTRYSARHAKRIIAISDNTRRDIARLYGVPLDQIDLAYPGVDQTLGRRSNAEVERFCREKSLPAKFLLFLGTLEPRKNLPMLIRAFAQMKQTCPDARLVLAGGIGWLADEIFDAVKLAGVEDRVIFAGFVAEAEKPLWYSAATAFVYPSIYEGFGLPPLEAMACGTPVIVSNASSLPEVVGEAGVLIDPNDERSWSAALSRVWNDTAYRAELTDRGVRQAKKFTWIESARSITATYRKAISDR
jgi:glycosyltransferase involved in cell wall biosynthesis